MRGHRFRIVLITAVLPLFSLAAADNNESTAGLAQMPLDRSLPPEPNAVFINFTTKLKAANWDKALEYCSAKVRAKAAEYDSPDTFFNTVLPLPEVAALAKFEICGTSLRNNKPLRYDHEIDLEDLVYEYPLEWHLSIVKEDLKWAMDFSTKPLDVWMKQAVLISKKINKELEFDPEKNRAGLETHLVPLSDQFTIGRPMLFRLELKNIAIETLFYKNTAYMVNDPLIIKDPSDTIIPFLGGDCQTAVSYACIEPDETIVLVEQYDVRSQYQLIKAGEYSFQFKNWSTPSSNIVKIQINAGPLSPLEECVQAIEPILPQKWQLSRTLQSADDMDNEQTGEIVSVFLTPERRGMSIDACILMLICPNEASNNVTSNALMEQYERLGQSNYGTVFMYSFHVDELWPDYREQLIKALKIDAHEQPLMSN